jgi:triosephosphate isomerase
VFLKPIVVANWKMHKTAQEAKDFMQKLAKEGEFLYPVYFAVPSTAIAICAENSQRSFVIGAQNFYPGTSGAFTGEVSSAMIKEAGGHFVLVGHSERRKLFGESNELIKKKLHAALEEGITPILCVGESWEQREERKAKEFIEHQLLTALEEISLSQLKSLLIAYEPVWAIGASKAASLEDVQEMHNLIRQILIQKWGEQVAHLVPLLYGGSVNEENSAALLSLSNVDGILVGRASLEVQKFATLLRNSNILTEKEDR